MKTDKIQVSRTQIR